MSLLHALAACLLSRVHKCLFVQVRILADYKMGLHSTVCLTSGKKAPLVQARGTVCENFMPVGGEGFHWLDIWDSSIYLKFSHHDLKSQWLNL